MDCVQVCLIFCASTAAASIVQTKYGPIEGSTITLYNGKEVDAFLGVPYAAPPINLNRFASPKPLTPWNETLKTTTLSNSCFQSVPDNLKKVIWFIADMPESEDCLYLNVWKPSNWLDRNMTTMIWIHPGAFFAGSASMSEFDGAILASEKKIIVVSMNYRLSLFGNLFLDTTEVPGNVGLQDQIQAIKWVNENIQNFGGNPNRITLIGQSSGSISVSLHLCNNDISNLFQYGIMESGSLNMAAITLTKDVALNYSITLGKTRGCPVNDRELLISCLRNETAINLLKDYKVLPTYGHFPFSPVRNGKEVPINPFVAANNIPVNKRKNLLAGNIPMEGSYITPMFFPGKLLTEDLMVSKDDLRALLKYYLQLNDKRLQDIVLHEYRDFASPNNQSQLRKEGLDIVSDTMFICPDTDFVKSYASDSNDIFYYQFNYRPSRSIKVPIPEWVGPTHGDEIPFVFGAPLNPNNGYNEIDRNVSKEIMTFWVNFANTGNPNGDGVVVWQDYKPNSSLIALEINKTLTTSEFHREKTCAFWRAIYPDLLTLQNQLEEENN